MKTYIVFFGAIALFSVANAQTIRRVSNTGATGLNVYTTAQAAHDAAAANDIIYLDPSSATYGSLTLSKPLVIYGNGYFLSSNPTLKADSRSSILDNISFNTGSGGSSMTGVTVKTNTTVYGVSNISIQRCNMNYIYLASINQAGNTNTNISNILISQNYFNVLDNNNLMNNTYYSSGVVVNNNIIQIDITAPTAYTNGWLVKNNTFWASGYTTTLANSTFDSNLITYTGGTFNLTSCTVSYNVSAGTQITGGISNQSNYAVSSDLVGTGSADAIYQIKSGSPLLTAGNAGIQVGAFGGTTPYIISGIAPIPSITAETNSAIGSSTTPLQVTISIKSNN